MADIVLPNYSEIARRAILLEPLGGPKDVFYYLDRFPEEIYNRSPDSHLYKFMRAVLGEAGVNWVKKNYFEARIALEELGLDAFDLDSFFGSPFGFGRIIEESLDEDPYGIIPREQWELIKAKNSRYRNRSLDYVNGARAGNTPFGMQLVAKAGLGHSVEIIENYKYLFDVHSDDPLGLDYYGKTLSTEEMVVLPRREVGASEQQMISIFGDPEYPNGGSFVLVYNGRRTSQYPHPDRVAKGITLRGVADTRPGYTVYSGSDDPLAAGSGDDFIEIPYNASNEHLRLALECIPDIGVGNVKVTGGPGPFVPWIVTFVGALADRDVPQLQVEGDVGFYVNGAIDPSNPTRLTVTTISGGIESVDEVINISPKDQYNLQSAMDRIRAQTTIMTLGEARGLRSRNNWRDSYAGSEYTEVVKYVSGNPDVEWPVADPQHPYYWIEAYREKEAPRISGDLQYHYTNFHNITSVQSSTGQADGALADYADPLFVTATTESNGANVSMVNGIYPREYQSLSGVPPVRYKEGRWTSADWNLQGFSRGQEQDEWLVFRFPFVKCINYASFEIQRDDVAISIDYDAYENQADALWVPVTPYAPYNNSISRNLDSSQNTWASVGLTFTNKKSELVWTRALRLRFHRTDSQPGHWGYPISVRNFRAGRNVT
jgi:hypothetical protein